MTVNVQGNASSRSKLIVQTLQTLRSYMLGGIRLLEQEHIFPICLRTYHWDKTFSIEENLTMSSTQCLKSCFRGGGLFDLSP